MNFIFDLTKTVQASALLLSMHDNRMHNRIFNILLYLIDRKALEKTNEPITGAKYIYISMGYGPTLLEVVEFITSYDLLDSMHLWKKYISDIKAGGYLRLLNNPSTDDLCEEEESIIKEVYNTYGHLNNSELLNLGDILFPEWKNCTTDGMPIIQTETILRHLGKSEQDILYVKQMISNKNHLLNLFKKDTKNEKLTNS